jgi:N-acetylneuraminate synthase/sialic acid synthase
MRKFVRDLRRARLAMGSGDKSVLEKETKPIQKMRKSIVAAADLPAGHVLTESDLALKSPGGGMLPYEIGELVGKTLAVAVAEDDQFSRDMFA